MPTITVEFYGLARLRAGRAELSVEAETVGEALVEADAACPNLHALSDTGLSRNYRVSIGGKRFIENLAEALLDRDTLLIFGADAGG
jgi:molybdopterin converting factor small subunit